MRIFSSFALILISICATVSAQYVDLYEFPDGTYGYVNQIRFDRTPGSSTQKTFTQDAYEEMKVKAADDGKLAPSTMGSAYLPDSTGNGGTLLLHSSIKVSHQLLIHNIPSLNSNRARADSKTNSRLISSIPVDWEDTDTAASVQKSPSLLGRNHSRKTGS